MVEISEYTNKQLMSLIDRACVIIKGKSPTPREYNVARQLWLIKRKIERINLKSKKNE